jgi:hypothetical protein
MADINAALMESDRDPMDVELRRTRALLEDLKRMPGASDFTDLEEQLASLELKKRNEGLAKTGAAAGTLELYKQARAVRRQIALQNPLLDFDEVVFTEVHKWGAGYIQGINIGKRYNGGRIRVLSGLESGDLRTRTLFDNIPVESGRYAGRALNGGAFATLDLHWDAEKIVFEWSPRQGGNDNHDDMWHPENTFKVFTGNIDGTNLVQVTDARRKVEGYAEEGYDDSHPCWLPNDRIAFVSTERRAHVRCSGDLVDWFQHCPTLFSVKADGSDRIQLSWHETTETYPQVDNHGRIIYTRWDYIERDFMAGHNIWISNPDGRDPRAPHGNYSIPLDAHDPGSPYNKGLLDGFTGNFFPDVRTSSPWSEHGIRPIPGSNKYIAVAGIHHDGPIGRPIIIDLNVEDDYMMSQVTPLTSDCIPGESWDLDRNYCGGLDYAWPWALSEDYYLFAYRNNDLVLLDRFGNRETLFSTGGFYNFAPLKKRERPPVIPTRTFQGERAGHPDHKRAVISVMNIYESDLPYFPEGTKVRELRIIQIFPKPWHAPRLDLPKMGYSYGAITRMSLGTAPVEEDGSVYVEAPVGKEIYFQALDENGMALASMRSGTYVHPGEHLSCVGCHENKWESIPFTGIPTALQRAPSKLMPEPGGVEPVNYHRLVRPVLEQKCIPCHIQENRGPTSSDYESQRGYAFWYDASGSAHALNRNTGGSRVIPGKFGAHYSRMGRALLNDNHQNYLQEGRYTEEDMRRITMWVDLNSLELGARHHLEEQRRGELVWPMDGPGDNHQGYGRTYGYFDELNPDDPQGIEDEYPVPGQVTAIEHLKEKGYISAAAAKGQIRVRDGLIHISNPDQEPLRLTLFDCRGIPVLTEHNNGSRDKAVFAFGRKRLSAGIYFLNITTPNWSVSRKIAITSNK